MKKIALFVLLLVSLLIGLSIYLMQMRVFIVSPLGFTVRTILPLRVYTFDSLRQWHGTTSEIHIKSKISETNNYQTFTFEYLVPFRPTENNEVSVSGVLNIPANPGIYPVIVMFRGYADKEKYVPGLGTQPTATYLASNGFITLAPDFLGYGSSASPSADAFEERFQTYVAALTLLRSIPYINTSLKSQSIHISADVSKIGLWGHSNGGQITLSILAICGCKYPTVLWAPVSVSFPYSILAYTNEADDNGKQLRKILSVFEQSYDTELFSPTNYYSYIHAPIQIHQGLSDQEVPYWWSDELVEKLKKNSLTIDYRTYPNADHNLLPSGWAVAVKASLDFYTHLLVK